MHTLLLFPFIVIPLLLTSCDRIPTDQDPDAVEVIPQKIWTPPDTYENPIGLLWPHNNEVLYMHALFGEIHRFDIKTHSSKTITPLPDGGLGRASYYDSLTGDLLILSQHDRIFRYNCFRESYTETIEIDTTRFFRKTKDDTTGTLVKDDAYHIRNTHLNTIALWKGKIVTVENELLAIRNAENQVVSENFSRPWFYENGIWTPQDSGWYSPAAGIGKEKPMVSRAYVIKDKLYIIGFGLWEWHDTYWEIIDGTDDDTPSSSKLPNTTVWEPHILDGFVYVTNGARTMYRRPVQGGGWEAVDEFVYYDGSIINGSSSHYYTPDLYLMDDSTLLSGMYLFDQRDQRWHNLFEGLIDSTNLNGGLNFNFTFAYNPYTIHQNMVRLGDVLYISVACKFGTPEVKEKEVGLWEVDLTKLPWYCAYKGIEYKPD